MAKGDSVDKQHLLLRRYNPDDQQHFWFDQGTSGVMRVKSGALSYGDDGFSFYDDAVLIENDLQRKVVLEIDTWRIVSATALEVRAVERETAEGEKVKLLGVIEDAYPDGTDDAPDRDVAHTLVTLPADVSKKQISRWGTALARILRETPLSRDSTPEPPEIDAVEDTPESAEVEAVEDAVGA